MSLVGNTLYVLIPVLLFWPFTPYYRFDNRHKLFFQSAADCHTAVVTFFSEGPAGPITVVYDCIRRNLIFYFIYFFDKTNGVQCLHHEPILTSVLMFSRRQKWSCYKCYLNASQKRIWGHMCLPRRKSLHFLLKALV